MATRFRTVQGGARQSNKEETYFDYSLLFTVLFLIAFGLMMIYSSSSYRANLDYNDSAHFLKNQLRSALLGIAAMIVVSRIPYHFWERLAFPAYIVSAVLIGDGYLSGFSGVSNGKKDPDLERAFYLDDTARDHRSDGVEDHPEHEFRDHYSGDRHVDDLCGEP